MTQASAFISRALLGLALISCPEGGMLTLGGRSGQVPRQEPEQLLQRVLQASYPELGGRHAFLEITCRQPLDYPWEWGASGDFGFRVKTGWAERQGDQDRPEGQGNVGASQTLLEGYFLFGPEGRIKQLWIGEAELANSKANTALRSLVESHPEWADSDALKALREAGAKFGPESKDELLRIPTLKSLGVALGALEAASAEFEVMREPHSGNFALLDWRVSFEKPGASAHDVSYVATFEPFAGRLVFLSKYPVAP